MRFVSADTSDRAMIESLFIGFTSVYIAAFHYSAEKIA